MESRAGDFGRLLKRWRRARNESQIGLAHLAGVSAKHVAFIETGRSRPSREMVLRLAQALDVPLRERNLLLRAAGFAEFYAESTLDAPLLEPARRAIEFVLARHEPYPAMVVDAAWNLHLANRAAGRLMAAFSTREIVPAPNVLRLLFDPRDLRKFVQNWTELAAHLLSRLQRDAVGATDRAPIRGLLVELLALPGVPDLLALPPREASLPVIPLVLQRGALHVRLFSLVSSFGTAVDSTLDELRIETLMPVDDATERTMRRIAKAGSRSARMARSRPAHPRGRA